MLGQEGLMLYFHSWGPDGGLEIGWESALCSEELGGKVLRTPEMKVGINLPKWVWSPGPSWKGGSAE